MHLSALRGKNPITVTQQGAYMRKEGKLEMKTMHIFINNFEKSRAKNN